jgi:hypothetical protein
MGNQLLILSLSKVWSETKSKERLIGNNQQVYPLVLREILPEYADC